MFERTPEKGLLDVLEDHQVGCIAFSPLAQGMLTDKYLQGIPAESRASRNPSLKPEQLTPSRLAAISRLNEMAQQRGQKLAEMAVAWLLRDDRVTSVLIGASKVAHVEDAYNALSNLSFTKAELKEIDSILDAAE
jgi:L-glyceraldehyde 3-phosphate reductase